MIVHNGKKYNIYSNKPQFYGNKKPLFSVIITSYNYDRYIGKTITQILNQTYQNFELIIIDDCSTDNSICVIEKLIKGKRNCKFIKNKENIGLTKSMKVAIDACIGKYVTFCESDDYWTEDNLQTKFERIRQLSDNDNIMLINDINIIHENGIRNDDINEKWQILKDMIVNGLVDEMNFRFQNYICTLSQFTCNRSIFNHIDMESPKDELIDWWIYRQIFSLSNHNIIFIDKQLTSWRKHNRSYIKKLHDTDNETKWTYMTKLEDTNKYVNSLDKLLYRKHGIQSMKVFDKVDLDLKHLDDVKFSIIIPTYNRNDMICDAIDSVCQQTYDNWEIVLVDDGSDESPSNIINEKYNDLIVNGKLKALYLDQHIGHSHARNEGLKIAEGNWICYLDSDNTMLKNYLSIYASKILTNPYVQCFYTFINYTNDNNTKTFTDLLINNYIDLGTFVHRADTIESVGYFDENMNRLVDWDFIIRHLRIFNSIYIGYQTYLYDNKPREDRVTTREYPYDQKNYVYKKHSRGVIPHVTTIITSYNNSRYLKDAILSAVKQNGNFIHTILISDDGSTDDSRDIINEMVKLYPNICMDISLEKNVGMSSNIRHAFSFIPRDTDYVTFLECDDTWEMDNLQSKIDILQEEPDVSLVFSKLNMVNRELKNIKVFNDIKQSYFTEEDIIESEYNMIRNLSTIMFRRIVIDAIPNEVFDVAFNEISLAIVASHFGKIKFINNILSTYRIHEYGQWSGKSMIEKHNFQLKNMRSSLYACHTEKSKQKIHDKIQQMIEKM